MPPLPLPERDILEGLGSSPSQILDKPLASATDAEVNIKDHDYIGSYNWASKERRRTIIVPGSPPVWTGRSPPFTLTADKGMHFVDHNGYCMGDRLLLPLFVAVKEQTPNFDWSTIDIVTDRNGLRKLLRWIQGDKKSFRIDLELVGQRTVLMRRWEKRYREEMPGYTYGFAFEKKMTEDVVGCEGSAGHHRIVTYDINGLKMVVRFEVDACTDDNPSPSAPAPMPSMDNLTKKLTGVKLTSDVSKEQPSKIAHDMTIIKAGTVVPGYSIVELGTISAHRLAMQNWNDKFLQVFLSRTPNHFLGIHTRGRFSSIQRRYFSSREFVAAKQQVQGDMKSLRKALATIQSLVQTCGHEERVSLVYDGSKMNVYKRNTTGNFLPEELMGMFDESE